MFFVVGSSFVGKKVLSPYGIKMGEMGGYHTNLGLLYYTMVPSDCGMEMLSRSRWLY